jgi:hypothetical protein
MKSKRTTKLKAPRRVVLPAVVRASINEWTKSELLSLPHRQWNNDSPRYDSLLIISTGKKHESGWAMMAIIGCRKLKPVEICTACSDDIEWKMPVGQYRSDCAIKSGALHIWTREGKFRVGTSLSSTEIELCRERPEVSSSPWVEELEAALRHAKSARDGIERRDGGKTFTYGLNGAIGLLSQAIESEWSRSKTLQEGRCADVQRRLFTRRKVC